MRRALCLLLGAAVCTVALTAQSPTPQSVASELLTADRAFAKSAASLTVIDAITAMLADNALVPGLGSWVEGTATAIEMMKTNPDNGTLRGPSWEPVGGGLSADGLHGYTYGFMRIPKADATLNVKYMSYWIKGAQGWRVVGYKRRPSGPGTNAVHPGAPRLLLPARLSATPLSAIEQARGSLTAAEQKFSDEAQKIGIGAAFEKNGSPDAVNMGDPSSPDFTYGNVAIAKSVGASAPGTTSPVSWAADFKTIVAGSGDLGVTFGFIKRNTPTPPGQPSGQPFFTIWRRASASAPWKYVAE